MEQHYSAFDHRHRMVITHPGIDLHFIASTLEEEFFRHKNDFIHSPTFVVNQALHGKTIIRQYHSVDLPRLDDYKWVNTQPATMELTEWEWRKHPLFQLLDKPQAEEIIAEPATVMQLLDQIRSMQAPEQARIRANQRRGEAPPQIHASILSFPVAV